MAGNAVIGALRVVLGAETAAFESGLKGAEKTLASFQANLARVGATIGVGIGAAAVALGISIKHAIDQADKMGKMAQQFGIPIEQLSALKLAADLSGVSIEDVGKAVGRMSKAMSEIAGGKASGGAADAFKALKIEVTSAGVGMKSSTQIMEEVADKFVGMKDGAGKTALAIQIFGRAGAALIPMLNQGADGLREAAKEAEALGLIIDTKTAKAAEAFNDNLTRLARVKDGIALKITAELAPAFKLLTDRMVEAAKGGDVVTFAAQKIMGGLDVVGRAGATTIHFFTSLAREAAALWMVLKAPNWTEMKKAWEEYNAEGVRSVQGTEAIRTAFQDFREQADMLARATENTANNIRRIEAPVLATKNALDEFFKSQTKAIAGQNAEAMTVGMLAGAKERLKLVMQAEAIAQENNIRLTDAMRMRITALANETAAAALKLAGAQLTEESLAPWAAYEKKLITINALLQAQAITAETAGRASRMAAEQAGATWEQVTSGAAGGFAALANEMGKSSSKMAAVGKAFGIVEATINTYVAFTKALASIPPPLNYVAAAGVLAAGMAKVIAIKSQSVPKMATGGAIRMGGFGGPDSQLLQARVRPDEQVDIWRPGEGPDQRRGAGGGGTIVVPIQGDVFTRPVLERWIDAVNGIQGDGAPKFKMA